MSVWFYHESIWNNVSCWWFCGIVEELRVLGWLFYDKLDSIKESQYQFKFFNKYVFVNSVEHICIFSMLDSTKDPKWWNLK